MNAVIVDDEELALDYLENLLTRTGETYNIHRFSDPLEAKTALESHPIDVLFIDIEMPHIGGFELAEHFLQADQNIQVVFVTAYQEFAVDAFEIDAVDYLVKPIRYDRLCKTMVRLKSRKKDIMPFTYQGKLLLSIKESISMINTHNQTAEISWRTAKARELFLFLIHHQNKFIPKSEIIDILWPDLDVEKAYPQLYLTVYHIRKSLKVYSEHFKLKNVDDGYRLELTNVIIDVFEWKKKLKASDSADQVQAAKTEALLEEYQGEYLQYNGYLWAGEERQNQTFLWREKAIELAGFYENNRQYNKSLYWYKKIERKDRIDEEIHLRIMKIYALQNRSEKVKQHYTDLAELLQQELGVTPDRLISDWYLNWIRSL